MFSLEQVLLRANNNTKKTILKILLEDCFDVYRIRESKTDTNEVITAFLDRSIKQRNNIVKISFLFDPSGNLKTYKVYFGG